MHAFVPCARVRARTEKKILARQDVWEGNSERAQISLKPLFPRRFHKIRRESAVMQKRRAILDLQGLNEHVYFSGVIIVRAHFPYFDLSPLRRPNEAEFTFIVAQYLDRISRTLMPLHDDDISCFLHDKIRFM